MVLVDAATYIAGSQCHSTSNPLSNLLPMASVSQIALLAKSNDGQQADPRLEGNSELVVFSLNDRDDPPQWAPRKKRLTLALVCIYAFAAVFGSAIYAPGETQVRERFGVSADVSSTGLAVYVLGFGLGPLLWGPLSELLGRKIPFNISWVILIASSAVSAFVENIAVIIVFRLVSGCAASCALTTGPGVIADLYSKDLRALGLASTVFAFCTLSGPCFATLVGFFIAAHTSHGLWVLRVQLFIVIAVWPMLFMLPETYGPTILEKRAKRLRKNGHANAWAAHELHHKSTSELLRAHVVRPFAMMIHEPIVQGAAVWVTMTYGILYFFFEVYPVVFITQHDIPFQLCGIFFLSISLGMVTSIGTFKSLLKLAERVRLPLIEPKDKALPMEETHLKIVLIGCLCLPISLFWFAWTSGPETHWIAPALAGVPFGFGTTAIFFCFASYISTTYALYSSSAIAANTFVRSVVAAIFPIIAHTVTDRLGTKWGVAIFAFIALAMIPIPFIFIRYGATLRARSRHAREAHEAIARMHEQNGLVLGQVGQSAVISSAIDKQGENAV
ncbi:MFS general substrate transporter [Trametes coccinea BRFM310]|uniref:MFS general substrate transporter n=1 Tax=Trametes coccinea (strain BRFM310) TaxID=1353009 RepID=A0A1Y2IVC6_TRAC3|nr:MFS general substrate transporter [Trametes coccinea BRFM310]